ncbi:sulfatase family protein [Pontiella sulfatireligans]|uniref:Arylsulfatase n=1 Tax=Pontiella sulfatireligans TaxID=2750658 RepID=A0A6C2UVU9_9BACT|nr:sulfatase-like hydrolase/transferase [Pontiella sulfatireligans]SPS74582.1 sulfatase S1_50 [Kiritimatiellales bacterium]VGO23531.1 Arylsulfatase [Pontiella sulfatireligans]
MSRIAVVTLVLHFYMAITVSTFANQTGRPNVLVIMVDDLGYGDLASFGAKDMRTPHIDRLMSEGMRFNEFYANCCVCSPTRAALLSGRYPEMVGIPGVVRTQPESNYGYLTPDSVMLPELFQKAGYHTTLIGKWHLGLAKPNRPNQRGFDEFLGFLGDMMDDYWTHLRLGNNYMRRNEEVIDPEGHATDLFTQWSIQSLEKREADGKPFFQYLAYNAPHFPIQPPEDWHERVKAREKNADPARVKNIAFVEHLDDGIGQVLSALDKLGLSENTIVVFTSDNGGKMKYGASNGALRSDKTHVYEGGIKVPTCVRWPGKIRAGQETSFTALTMDILPTLGDLCGVPLETEIEGRSFKPVLLEGKQAAFTEPVFHMWLQNGTKEAMREGDWKLVRDNPGDPFELYNLKNDPFEKVDLANEQPERLERMVRVLMVHMEKAQKIPWKRPEAQANVNH